MDKFSHGAFKWPETETHVIIDASKRMTDVHDPQIRLAHIYAPKKCEHTHMHTVVHTKVVHYTAHLNMSHQYDRPSETQRGNEPERQRLESKDKKKSGRKGKRGRENVIE